jgi:uncharacterized membrane protein YhhN
MAGILVPVLALAAAALAILFNLRSRRNLVLLFRPLAMILIIATACGKTHPVSTEYQILVIAGLVLSLAGDVFMMLPQKRFGAGLASFLAAHVCYILAFRPLPGRPLSPGTILPFIVLGLLIFRFLSPSLGKMRFPVLVYVAAISVMAAFAAGRFIDSGGTGPFLSLAGAVLFMASDAVLAYDRFVRKIDRAQLLILGLYYPAQLLIALSV